MRRSDEPRIRGPYDRGERYRDRRYRVDVITGGETGDEGRRYFATETAASDYIATLGNETQGTTVRQAVDAYLDDCRERGCTASTVENYEHRLWRLLGLPANEQRPIRWVQPRGAELYAGSVRGAPDTHHNGLLVGRTWAKFCVEKCWLRSDPFAAVKPKGRRTPGSTKSRLKVDECRVLEAYCLAHGDDPACVLTYGYLMLGKRASELARVTTADLDDNGWLLRISKAKTEASVGTLPLSPQLRDMMLGLADATRSCPKPSERPRIACTRDTGDGVDACVAVVATDGSRALFTQDNGAPMSRYAARDRVLRVTKAAIGRAVTPQELRRTFVDNANRQGFALATIAEQTGHTSPAVTMRNYMSREAAQAGAVERNLRVVQGGKR